MPYYRYETLREGVLRDDGYIAPPYVIDAHAHIHLHIPHPGEKPFKDYYGVSEQLGSIEKSGFIDPKSLIREMDRYGIDKAVILAADGMLIDFDQYVKHLEAYPDRFIGFFWPQYDWFEADIGERRIDSNGLAEQAEKILNHPQIKGLGEGTIQEAVRFCDRKGWPADDMLRFMMPMLEVVAAKRAPIIWHSGPHPYKNERDPSEFRKNYKGFGGSYIVDPMIYDEIAALYPEIPIIIAHCGVQGSYFYNSFADHAMMMAAIHENVFLETSMAPAELIEKAIHDPAIGAEKLVLGSDFGATSSYYVHNGKVLPSYKKGPFPELPGGHIEQAVRVLNEVVMTPEERRLIMGQNMARILQLD